MPYLTNWPPFFLLYLSIHFYIHTVIMRVPDILYVKKIDPMVNLFPNSLISGEADNYNSSRPDMAAIG